MECKRLFYGSASSRKGSTGRRCRFLYPLPRRIDDEAVKAAKNLKLIQLVSAGYDAMNTTLCQELSIPIANNGGANAIDVAEHTVAMILGAYRGFGNLIPMYGPKSGGPLIPAFRPIRSKAKRWALSVLEK